MNMAFVDNNDFIEQHQHNLPHLTVLCFILQSFRTESAGYNNSVTSMSPAVFQHSAPVRKLVLY